MRTTLVCGITGLLLAAGATAAGAPAAGEDSPSGLPELTPEQLESYQFERDPDEPEAVVEPLSKGQAFILKTQRQETLDLIARDLGIMHFEADLSDLATLQRIYDRKILRKDQIREWQGVGILFGDILVERFSGLHWVSYEDELGASKALQWRDTRNFVFPITVFSKRVQFGEAIDVRAIYDAIAADIERFADYERRVRGS